MKQLLLNSIEKDIKRNTTIRNARIISSERLRKYSEKWNVIFVWLNLIAVIGTVLGIALANIPASDKFPVLNINPKNSKIMTLVSALFSLYVILVQDFVGKENYSERSLKLHYHQLSLKRVINELTKLKLRINSTPGYQIGWKDLDLYKAILNERNQSLSGYENHDVQDYREAKFIERQEEMQNTGSNSGKTSHGWRDKIKEYFESIDFSVENIQIFIQWIIIMGMIMYYVFVLLGLNFKYFICSYLGICLVYAVFEAVVHLCKKDNIKYK